MAATAKTAKDDLPEAYHQLTGHGLQTAIARKPELFECLPAGRPQQQFFSVQQDCAEFNAVERVGDETRREKIEKAQQHKQKADDLKRTWNYADNHPEVQSQYRLAQKFFEEVHRLDKARAAREPEWRDLNRLKMAIEGDLNSLPEGMAIEGEPPVEWQLRKGESASTALERCRRYRRELHAKLDRADAAPVTAALAKERVKEFIARVAKGPELYPVVEHRRSGSAIIWPTASQQNGAFARDEAINIVTHNTDVVALLAWLFPDQLLAKIEAEIDEISDDDEALSDADRLKLMNEIRNDILHVEREETHWVSVARAGGALVHHRPDVDYRALLSLSGNLPAPKGAA
jgi:hypothetical protein